MKKVSPASVAGLQAQLVEKRTVYERAKESYDAMRQDLATLASPYEVEDVLVYRLLFASAQGKHHGREHDCQSYISCFHKLLVCLKYHSRFSYHEHSAGRVSQIVSPVEAEC